MKIIIPNNIFATLMVLALAEEDRPEIEVKEASLIANELLINESSVGLIPSFDLISNRELFVSNIVGLGFDGPLSNSYMYFSEKGNLEKIKLRGDITTNEAILTKIVMQERYNISPEVILDSGDIVEKEINYLISGNENWIDQLHEKGISFSEQVSELIDQPYQNFIFASQNEEAIKKVNKIFNKIFEKVFLNLEELLQKIGLDEDVNDLIRREIEFVYYNQSNNDALNDLLKLAYYHQIIDDLFDVRFVQ